MTIRRTTPAILFTLLFALLWSPAWAAGTCPASTPDSTDTLPRVLIIGDSISIGYTPIVQRVLRRHACVVHAPGNNAFSAHGLAHAADWVGDHEWHVIYFNHGIWDVQWLAGRHLVRAPGGTEARIGAPFVNFATLYFGPWQRRSTPAEYLSNLNGIVDILLPKTQQVIFATTTQWTRYGADTAELIKRNNAAARDLMQQRGVPVDDLYAVALPHLTTWHSADGLHFNERGNEGLGAQVARTIAGALANQIQRSKDFDRRDE